MSQNNNLIGIRYLQPTIEVNGTKATLNLPLIDSSVGLIICSGHLVNTQTYFNVVYSYNTMYSPYIVLSRGGANLSTIEVENNKIEITTNGASPSANIDDIKVAFIGRL